MCPRLRLAKAHPRPACHDPEAYCLDDASFFTLTGGSEANKMHASSGVLSRRENSPSVPAIKIEKTSDLTRGLDQ